jgi:tRNA threonylcarbamoyladenosine biosynthesis protein TsaB
LAPSRLVGSAARAVAAGLAKSAPVPPTVDPRDAPDIAWVAQIGAVTSEEKSPPRPFYLRAPDAQPQNAAQLPRR